MEKKKSFVLYNNIDIYCAAICTYKTRYLEQKFDFQNVFITRIINLIMQHVLYENIDHLLPMYKFLNTKGAPEY